MVSAGEKYSLVNGYSVFVGDRRLENCRVARVRRSVAAASPGGQAELLEVRAREKRRRIIEMIARAGLGHVGGDLSVTDILTALYDAVLDIDPDRPRPRRP